MPLLTGLLPPHCSSHIFRRQNNVPAPTATLVATGRWRGSPASGLYANYPRVSAPMAANSGSTVLLCLGYLDSDADDSLWCSSMYYYEPQMARSRGGSIILVALHAFACWCVRACLICMCLWYVRAHGNYNSWWHWLFATAATCYCHCYLFCCSLVPIH